MLRLQAAEAACGGNIHENAHPCKPFFEAHAFFCVTPARALGLSRAAGCAIKPGMNALATYIHNLDPVILDIPGTPLALRWYGLAYVAGFILGYMVLLALSKRRLYAVEPGKLGDFITSVCIFGVLLGGRLGEFLFYWLPENGLAGFMADPLWVLRVWEGGMASHGGILGVLTVACLYAHRHKLSALAVCDGLAIVAPIGLFFGRVANFINGELYGRVTDSALAVKFPQELFELPAAERLAAVVHAEQAAGAPLAQLARENEGAFDTLLRLCRENPAVQEAVSPHLHGRYPSQLFEAVGEGLFIFAVLITLRLTLKNARAGFFSGVFCLLYAAARITCECFKQPDAAVWHGITQGQLLSLIVVAMGVFFLCGAARGGRTAA